MYTFYMYNCVKCKHQMMSLCRICESKTDQNILGPNKSTALGDCNTCMQRNGDGLMLILFYRMEGLPELHRKLQDGVHLM